MDLALGLIHYLMKIRMFYFSNIHAYLHGLQTPRERAFFKNLKLMGLGRQIGLKCFEAFGVFLAKL